MSASRSEIWSEDVRVRGPLLHTARQLDATAK